MGKGRDILAGKKPAVGVSGRGGGGGASQMEQVPGPWGRKEFVVSKDEQEDTSIAESQEGRK